MATEFESNTPRETSHGLPVVSKSTFDSIWENYTKRERWGDHLEEVKVRLLQENPYLTRFIESQVSKFAPELHNEVFAILVGTIAVLEHQASANKLSSRFDPSPQS